MSYARFSWADVYVYLDVAGALRCCQCSLDGDFWARSTAEMVAHLERHAAAGHHVPGEAIEALQADASENDAWMAGEHPPGPHESRTVAGKTTGG